MSYNKFALLSALCLFHLQAEESKDNEVQLQAAASEPEQEKKQASPPDSCGQAPHPYRIELRHIESKGIGYNQGYSTVEGFFTVPSLQNSSWIPFFSAAGHVFNDGKPAATAGVGLRYLTTRTWGLNAFYDYRKTEHFHYNRVGAGFETLGERWDYRINGYAPVGKKTSPFYQKRFDKFEGHHLILSRKQEFAMNGVNAEAGVHFAEAKNYNFYAAAGPYYMWNEGKAAWGGEARLNMNAFEYLRVQLSGSYDNIYHGIVQGQLSLVIPFGGRKRLTKQSLYAGCPSQLTMSQRAMQAVDRFEIIPVDHKKHHTTANNPGTGKPYRFVCVNNSAGDADGTFESPYPDLLVAEMNSGPNDILYVFPGTGPYVLETSLVLQKGQKLLGAGVDYRFPTQWGRVNVRHQAKGLPVITSSGTGFSAIVVNLANSNNDVAGVNLTMNNPFVTSGGISGALAITGGTNYNISQNMLIAGGTSTAGLSLLISTGTVTISNNVFASGVSTESYGIISSASEGSLNINNNLFTGLNPSTGLQVGIEVSHVIGNQTVSITNNTFNSQSNTGIGGPGSTGIYLLSNAMSTGNIFANISGNQITLPPGMQLQAAGIHLQVTTGSGNTISATLTDNSSVSTAVSPAPGNFFENHASPTQLQIDFRNNTGTVSYDVP